LNRGWIGLEPQWGRAPDWSARAGFLTGRKCLDLAPPGSGPSPYPPLCSIRHVGDQLGADTSRPDGRRTLQAASAMASTDFRGMLLGGRLVPLPNLPSPSRDRALPAPKLGGAINQPGSRETGASGPSPDQRPRFCERVHRTASGVGPKKVTGPALDGPGAAGSGSMAPLAFSRAGGPVNQKTGFPMASKGPIADTFEIAFFPSLRHLPLLLLPISLKNRSARSGAHHLHPRIAAWRVRGVDLREMARPIPD